MDSNRVNASDVQRCREEHEEAKRVFARIDAAFLDTCNRCTHVYEDGTSALGRGDGMGAGERLCNACRQWIET